jgi:hypothetical protein
MSIEAPILRRFQWYREFRGGRWAQVSALFYGKKWVRVPDGCVERVQENYGQGLCEATWTPRYLNPLCKCPTYKGNLGPCASFPDYGFFDASPNGRCVFCDHEWACHETLMRQNEKLL